MQTATFILCRNLKSDTVVKIYSLVNNLTKRNSNQM